MLRAYPFWSDGDLEGRDRTGTGEDKLQGRRDRVGWIYATLKENRGGGEGGEGGKGGGERRPGQTGQRERQTKKVAPIIRGEWEFGIAQFCARKLAGRLAPRSRAGN